MAAVSVVVAVGGEANVAGVVVVVAEALVDVHEQIIVTIITIVIIVMLITIGLLKMHCPISMLGLVYLKLGLPHHLCYQQQQWTVPPSPFPTSSIRPQSILGPPPRPVQQQSFSATSEYGPTMTPTELG